MEPSMKSPAATVKSQVAANNENHEDQKSSDQDMENETQLRRRNHTLEQKQMLEAVFRRDSHPDEQRRKALGEKLGLEPTQVKFWFQNKRTKDKRRYVRKLNQQLKDENQKLLSKNTKLKKTLDSAACFKCGSTVSLGENARQFMMENALLREKIIKWVVMIRGLEFGGKVYEENEFVKSLLAESQREKGASL